MKTIALCVDKENGRLLFGKRTSEDREVRKKLLSMTERITVDEYTASQFREEDAPDVHSRLDVMEHPEKITEGFAFLEKQDIPPDADRIIIFNWNRKYPADRWFDFSFSGWRKVKKEDFEGYSHPKITMEIWERK